MVFLTGTVSNLLKYGLHYFRTKRWWRRVFFHLIDVSMTNAMVLYNRSSTKKLSQLDFRLSVISSLLEGHTPREDKRHYNPQRQLPLRLTERPFPERIPISSDSATKGRPLCEVCRARGIRSQTRYRCKACHTPLHMEKYLEIYHTTLHYGH